MMISTPCLFRADASPRMGIGHVMRCLALAQAVHAEKGRAVFLSHCESQSLHRRVETAGIRFLPLGERHPHPADLSTTLALLRELQAAWLVLDGYNFDPGYQQAIRGAGHRLLVIDDMAHFPEYHADLLLNQNINAGQLRYACGPDTTLLLGPRYALLRPEFLTWRGWRREIPRMARNLLVTMGGGDPDNVTLRIVRVLHRVRGIELEAKVVVGPASPHTEELRQAVDGTDGRLHLLANVTDMPALMAWADVALAAGGSTCWELAFMGVPSMAIVLADNQRALAEELGRRGVVVNLGWHEKVTPTQITQAVTRLMADGSSRIEMACRGRELVDGEGTDRVLMRLCGERFRLRRVCEADGRLLWEWANDPTVRRVSFSPEPIPWAQHVNWLKARLEDPN